MKGKSQGDEVVTLRLTRAQATLLAEAVMLARTTQTMYANLTGSLGMLQKALDMNNETSLFEFSKTLLPYAVKVYPLDTETKKVMRKAMVKRRTK